MDPADLERLVDRAVSSLPTPPAPPTLLPRVMRAVAVEAFAAAPAAPRRSWFEWSWPAKVASVVAIALVVTGTMQLGPAMAAALTSSDGALSWLPIAGSLRRLGAWVNTGVVLWRVVQPFAVAGVVLVTVMCAACAAFGAALKSVALEGSST
jgi:hypothetical protein